MKSLELASKAVKRLEQSMAYIIEDWSKAPQVLQKVLKLLETETKSQLILYHPDLHQRYTIEVWNKVPENRVEELTKKIQKVRGIDAVIFNKTMLGNSFKVTLK